MTGELYQAVKQKVPNLWVRDFELLRSVSSCDRWIDTAGSGGLSGGGLLEVLFHGWDYT
jgi:hypothetical protein